MKTKSLAIIALLGEANSIRMEQSYAVSGYPTKADYGENDQVVLPREYDLNNLSKKESGWVNPLSVADNGEDDESVLNMQFKPLGEKAQRKPAYYQLDEDTLDSMNSEYTAEILVPIYEKRYAQQRKEAMAKAAEYDKKVAEEKANEKAQYAKMAADSARKAADVAKQKAEEAEKLKEEAEKTATVKEEEAKKEQE